MATLLKMSDLYISRIRQNELFCNTNLKAKLSDETNEPDAYNMQAYKILLDI